MGFYFDDNLSIATKTGGDAVKTLEVVGEMLRQARHNKKNVARNNDD